MHFKRLWPSWSWPDSENLHIEFFYQFWTISPLCSCSKSRVWPWKQFTDQVYTDGNQFLAHYYYLSAILRQSSFLLFLSTPLITSETGSSFFKCSFTRWRLVYPSLWMEVSLSHSFSGFGFPTSKLFPGTLSLPLTVNPQNRSRFLSSNLMQFLSIKSI